MAGMRSLLARRRTIAIVCGVALLLAALALPGGALPLLLLIPLWSFVAAIVSFPLLRIDGGFVPRLIPVTRIHSPRPPPAR